MTVPATLVYAPPFTLYSPPVMVTCTPAPMPTRVIAFEKTPELIETSICGQKLFGSAKPKLKLGPPPHTLTNTGEDDGLDPLPSWP